MENVGQYYSNSPLYIFIKYLGVATDEGLKYYIEAITNFKLITEIKLNIFLLFLNGRRNSIFALVASRPRISFMVVSEIIISCPAYSKI